MKTNITWTRGFFSSVYKIFSNDESIGNLEDNSFSQTAKASFAGKDYVFRTKGFLKQNTEIIDSSDNTVIGKIEFNSWMTKADISINDKIVKWKYDNAWNTQWSLSDDKDVIMTFKGSTTKGEIDSNDTDGLLVLSGLFVTNYYWQTSFAFLIPLIIVVII